MKIRTKIREVNTGKVYEAELEGQRGGDLFGGRVKKGKSWYDLSSVGKFEALKKTPFIDVNIYSKKVDKFNVEDKLKRMLG